MVIQFTLLDPLYPLDLLAYLFYDVIIKRTDINSLLVGFLLVNRLLAHTELVVNENKSDDIVAAFQLQILVLW